MELHIGQEIEAKYQESGIKLSEFAKRLNTGTRNVYSIFERKDISSGQLKRISDILGFNFFELYERGLESAVHEARSAYRQNRKSKIYVVVDLDGTQSTLDKWTEKLSAINKLI